MPGLAERIQYILTIDPEKGAIEFNQHWFSWGQLLNAINRLEAILTQSKVAVGAPVAIILRNRPAHVAAAVEILMTRRCIAPINPFQTADKIAADIKNLNISVVLADPEDWQKPEISDAVTSIGAIGVKISTDTEFHIDYLSDQTKPSGTDYMPAMEDTAVLMLTSGTTGPAKRIKLPYKSFEQSVMSAVNHYEKNGAKIELKSGVSLISGPLVHIGGMYFIFDSIVGGRSFCLLEKFNVEDWVRAVKAYKIKTASLPPSAIRMLVDAGTPKENLDSLICIRAGSAPLPLELQDEFQDKYGIPILDVYGATEFSGAIAGWTMRDFKKFSKTKRGSVGRAQPGVELRVVDQNTFEPLTDGSTGLLEVRSIQTSSSEWLRTTDLVDIDDDGFLFIRGRADNAIIRGGFKILPLEIEALIEEHPAVKVAAVIGIPDQRLGAVPVAAVQLHPNTNASEAELSTFIRSKTVAYKVPVEIKILAEMPRTPSMKVSQHMLKQMFLQASA